MKTLNNLSILAFIALAFIGSCSKNTNPADPLVALTGITALADTKISSTDLPQTVLDYVATNYPNTTISKSEMEDSGNFEVKLKEGTELVFGVDGTFSGIDDDTNEDFGDTVIDPVNLPQIITDYVAGNHAGLSITSASLENNGHYEVLLSDGTELVFDDKGGYLGIGVDKNEYSDANDDAESNDEGQNGNQHEDGTIIDLATLPQLAKDYLSTTYPDASIVEARSMVDGGYEVELSTKIEIIFDSKGSFVKTENEDNKDDD